MKVNCVECPICKEIVYSRSHYDCRKCSCGDTYIDGGFEYTRVGFNPKNGEPKMLLKELKNVTKKQLDKDFNLGINKYGKI